MKGSEKKLHDLVSRGATKKAAEAWLQLGLGRGLEGERLWHAFSGAYVGCYERGGFGRAHYSAYMPRRVWLHVEKRIDWEGIERDLCDGRFCRKEVDGAFYWFRTGEPPGL